MVSIPEARINLKRQGIETEISLHPAQGWIPNEKRLILKLLFMIVKVFKDWPKSYEWKAIINLGSTKYPFMKSSWRRV